MNKPRLFAAAILLTVGHSVWAANSTYNFSGAVTILDGSNNVLLNGPLERTEINGTFTIDSVNNSGILTANTFSFLGSDWITQTTNFLGGSSNQLYLDYEAAWSM